MKKLIVVFLFGFLTAGFVDAAFPKGKLTVRVLDELGNPIAQAKAKAYFYEASSFNKEFFTDTNGMFVVEGRCDGGLGGGIEKEGYYRQGFGYPWKYKDLNKILNRWMPWNPTVTVSMKKIRNPVPMVYKQVRADIPVFDPPVGFDLEKGDFVTPHGSGIQADFIFTAVKMTNVLGGATITLTFPNELDGIMPYPFDKQDNSWFKWPYEAPLIGYTNRFSKYEMQYEKVVDRSGTGLGYWETLKPIETDCVKDDAINYIFRVRSHADENGNLIRACYGKIQGEIRVWRTGGMEFRYWFSPEWTRSLEDDPKRNINLD